MQQQRSTNCGLHVLDFFAKLLLKNPRPTYRSVFIEKFCKIFIQKSTTKEITNSRKSFCERLCFESNCNAAPNVIFTSEQYQTLIVGKNEILFELTKDPHNRKLIKIFKSYTDFTPLIVEMYHYNSCSALQLKNQCFISYCVMKSTDAQKLSIVLLKILITCKGYHFVIKEAGVISLQREFEKDYSDYFLLGLGC